MESGSGGTAPSQGYEQQPQQTQQQYPQQYQQRGFLEKVTSDSGMSKAIALGFILLLVGMIFIHAAPFWTNWGLPEERMPRKKMAKDESTQNAMRYIGHIIADIGIFLVGLVLALGGIHRDDLNTKYRIAMVGFSILFILVAWFGFLTEIPISV